MKLSPQELLKIKMESMNLNYLKGFVTYQEMFFYMNLFGSAFYNSKKGRRGLSMLQVHHMVEWGYNKKRIQTILSRLTRLELIKPHYHVPTKEGMYVTSDLDEFDGPNGLGRKRIKYTKYEVLLLPGEAKLIKKAKSKKKT